MKRPVPSFRCSALTLLAALGASCAGSSQNARPTETTTSTTASTTTTSTTAAGADAEGASEDAAAGPAATGADAGATAQAADAAPPAVELPPMPENLHGPTTPWARMNARARATYMEQHVMPVMSTLLRAYDGTRFANVTCASCHGENARAVHFRMPNTLPTFPTFGTEASNRDIAAHPRTYAMMRERFVPVMAQLLGMQPYNPQTHQGFGCAGCHPMGTANAASAGRDGGT